MNIHSRFKDKYGNVYEDIFELIRSEVKKQVEELFPTQARRRAALEIDFPIDCSSGQPIKEECSKCKTKFNRLLGGGLLCPSCREDVTGLENYLKTKKEDPVTAPPKWKQALYPNGENENGN